jgi:Flp pilus assembly protein TadD
LAFEAIPHYELLLKASPNDANLHSDFAAALAQVGQFARAAAELSHALTLLGPAQETEAQKFRERIGKYQAGRRE